MTPTKRGFLRAALAGCAVALSVAAALGLADMLRIGNIPAPCERNTHWRAAAALVLSGGPHFRRTKHAVALFRAGHVDRLAFSGAGNGGDSGELLARMAQRLGVPPERIVVEPNARSTYQNFRFSCALPALASAHRIAIVTAQWHALRSYLTAVAQCRGRQLCSAPVPEAVTAQRRRSETLKLWRYQLLGRAAWW